MEPIHRLLGNCRPVTEDELNKVFNELSINLTDLGFKFGALGSFNKKKEGDLYNDLDIAIEVPFEVGKDIIKQICLDNEDKTILGKINDKFNTVSIGYKLGDGTNLQVDFMFVDRLSWAQFAFHSPDFKKDESKYKGMYASILLQAVIRNLPIKKEYDDNNNLINYTYLSLCQKDGIHKKSKTFIGKKGNLIKTPKITEDIILSNDPNYVLEILFNFDVFNGSGIPDRELYSIVWSFEKLLDYLPGALEEMYFDKSFSKEYLERVKHDFLTDWEFNLKTPDELKKEFEGLFNDKINSL